MGKMSFGKIFSSLILVKRSYLQFCSQGAWKGFSSFLLETKSWHPLCNQANEIEFYSENQEVIEEFFQNIVSKTFPDPFQILSELNLWHFCEENRIFKSTLNFVMCLRTDYSYQPFDRFCLCRRTFSGVKLVFHLT